VLGKDYQAAADAYTGALKLLLPEQSKDEEIELLRHKVACNAALAGMFNADPSYVSGCNPCQPELHWLSFPACAPTPCMF
jgi:hypothetical protein